VVVRGSGAFGLLAGVAIVAVLPLYGDPGPSSVVAHPEWARMVERGLDLLSDEPGLNDTAAQVFATLSGRESRTFSADQYVRATRVELQEQDGAKRLRPVGGIGEAVYAMSVAQPGEYRVRFRIASPSTPEVELTKVGQNAVLYRLSVPAAAQLGWVYAGSVNLDRGAYDATVLLPEGAALQSVEIAPPCVHPIEPLGGWKPAAVTTTGDVAVTVLRALDLESELPPVADSVEFHGGDLRLDDGARMVEAEAGSGAFSSGPRGARVLLIADVPQAGLYTLSAFGVAAGGQRWMSDGCRIALVCPTASLAPEWRAILSGQLQEGRHVFSATLGPGTRIERLRLEPKKDTAADYAATAERLGLALGPGGPDAPVGRDKAEEARRFLERRHAQLALEQCGDVLAPGTLLAETAAGAAAGGSGGAAGGPGAAGGGGGRGGTVPPPIVPPVPPASPTLPTGVSGS
jgi:hypothetical protein